MVALVERAQDSAVFCSRRALAVCSHARTMVQKTWALMPEIRAVLTGTLPNAAFWCWRTKVTKTITETSLQCTVDRVAYRAQLFYHGNEWPQAHNVRGGRPMLFLHGDDGGHPSNTLHIMDRALSSRKGPVYSVCVWYRDAYPEPHQRLLDLAIDRIFGENPDTTIIGIGYSHGCAELAHRVYIMKDTRIGAVIAIAGRLKMTNDRGPKPDKASLIRAIERARLSSQDDFPLFQIGAGDRDWCMPPEASVVTPGRRSQQISDAMHINLVFHKTALAVFDQFLDEAQQS